MKTLKMYIQLIAVFSILIINHEAMAQSYNTVEVVTVDARSVDCSKAALAKIERKNNTISEQDYPYLMDVECLKNGYLKNSKGRVKLRNISTVNPTHFVLRGKGIRTSVHAIYDQDGKLIQAELNKKDIALPIPIRKYIFESYNEWSMTGNEMIVRDFDAGNTEFKVNLKNGSEEQTLVFKKNGHHFEHLAGL